LLFLAQIFLILLLIFKSNEKAKKYINVLRIGWGECRFGFATSICLTPRKGNSREGRQAAKFVDKYLMGPSDLP
jgi:hypothetical protein